MEKLPQQRMVQVDYRWIDARPIEELTDQKMWGAIYLAQTGWDRCYLVNKREGWKKEDYFLFAEKRLKELGIEKP